MTHLYMLHTVHGFEMQVFETIADAAEAAQKLKRFSAYRGIDLNIIRIEPAVEGNIIQTIKFVETVRDSLR